jgi:lysozyme
MASTNKRLIAPAAAATLLALALSHYLKPLEGDSLDAYRDIVGVWTWCQGITEGPHKEHYTRAECDALNRNEAAKHLAELASCIHRPLPENVWVALGSWEYNAGKGAACGSTLVRMVNRGDPPEAYCEQLMRWNRAGGREVLGLTRRRAAERALCLGEVV